MTRQPGPVRVCLPLRVRQAYAELSTLAQSLGWSLFHGKSDLWVGAAAHAADAHLLTDGHGLPPTPRKDWLADHVLDDKTGLPRA